MKLVQTILFGVRGERYTIKKRSPFGKLLTHGQAPVMNVRLDNPEACEPKRQALAMAWRLGGWKGVRA